MGLFLDLSILSRIFYLLFFAKKYLYLKIKENNG